MVSNEHCGCKRRVRAMPNLQEVKEFLEANKDSQEVQEFLRGLKTVSVEDVKGFLETDEGKRFIQPELDRYHNKSLNTWKENNLQKLIDDEVAKLNPEKTEAERRIEALEQQLQERDREANREKLRNFALGKAQELGVPSSLIDRFLGEDENSTLDNLNELKNVFDSTIQSKVEEKFKQSGRNIDGPGNGNPVDIKSPEELAAEANVRNKNY